MSNEPITVNASQFRELVWKAAQYDAARIHDMEPTQREVEIAKIAARLQWQRRELKLLHAWVEKQLFGARMAVKGKSVGGKKLSPNEVKPGMILDNGFGERKEVVSVGVAGFIYRDEYTGPTQPERRNLTQHWIYTGNWSVVDAPA